MRVFRFLVLFFGLSLVPGIVSATTVIIDFEGLSDSTSVTNQFSGLLLSNATVLTAGISLNEFEFPPHSGSNVVFDDGGPISILFSVPVISFGGYFTYGTQLTLSAQDTFDNPLPLVLSAFANNEGLSGDLGSSPNEFLEVSYLGGISGLTITGDPSGGSFTLDDATITTPNATSVPEPGTASLIFLGGLAVLVARRRLC